MDDKKIYILNKIFNKDLPVYYKDRKKIIFVNSKFVSEKVENYFREKYLFDESKKINFYII